MPKPKVDNDAFNFYNNDKRWDTVTEDLNKVYYDTFYPDATTYGIVPIHSGDTIKYADNRDNELYQVIMVNRSNGLVFARDNNNLHRYMKLSDIEKAEASISENPLSAPDDSPMSGGASESMEIQFNWKKAMLEFPVKVGQAVLIKTSGLTGMVIGTVVRDQQARVAYHDPFGQLYYKWFDVDDLMARSGKYEKVACSISETLSAGCIEKVGQIQRSDIKYEAQSMKLGGVQEEEIIQELAKAFNMNEGAISEILEEVD